MTVVIQEVSVGTVLVTGGAGFIGSHLIERLLAHGHGVICVDNFDGFYSPSLKEKNVLGSSQNSRFSLVRGDIRDTDLLEGVFQGDDFKAVVHLAARAGVRPSLLEPKLYADVNVRGTVNLLELSVKHRVERFIFGSSSSVYGISSKLPFHEDDRVNRPISPYGATKLAGEQMCYTFHHLYDLRVVILRFFTVYGPRQRPDMAVHKFTRAIDRGQEVTIYGNGRAKRDYTYISDIMDGIMAVLGGEFEFEIFNLGNSRMVELRELVATIEGCLGKRAKVRGLPDQPGDVPVTFADIGKAREMLGYNPQVTIGEGVERFVDWYKESF